MLASGFPVAVARGFVSVAGRSLLVGTMALALWLGAAKVARAELSCPPECVKCNQNPKCGWYKGFCYCTLDPDVTTMGDILVEDAVLT